MPQTLLSLPMVGPYTLTQNGIDTVSPAPNDTLSDNSDATYIDVDRYLAPPNVFYGQVEGQMVAPPGSTPYDDPRIVVYARFRGGPIDSVILQVIGAGESSYLASPAQTVESTLGTLYRMDSNGLRLANAGINGYNVRMSVTVPPSTGHDLARIYEAWIVVALPTYGAPPCRNIKRGDRFDLGGARNYPPSKMQQTSSRGVGAY